MSVANQQVLERFMDRFAAKIVGNSTPMDVLFVGGPVRGEIAAFPPQVHRIVPTGTDYEYVVTGELAQRRDGTQQVRVARPAAHVQCGFLPMSSLLGGFICVRGHGL